MGKVIKFYLRSLIARRSDETGERLTYADISKVTGIGSSTLSRMATGKITAVSFAVLERLCAFFDCELHDLMRLAEDDHD